MQSGEGPLAGPLRQGQEGARLDGPRPAQGTVWRNKANPPFEFRSQWLLRSQRAAGQHTFKENVSARESAPTPSRRVSSDEKGMCLLKDLNGFTSFSFAFWFVALSCPFVPPIAGPISKPNQTKTLPSSQNPYLAEQGWVRAHESHIMNSLLQAQGPWTQWPAPRLAPQPQDASCIQGVLSRGSRE